MIRDAHDDITPRDLAYFLAHNKVTGPLGELTSKNIISALKDGRTPVDIKWIAKRLIEVAKEGKTDAGKITALAELRKLHRFAAMQDKKLLASLLMKQKSLKITDGFGTVNEDEDSEIDVA